MRTSLRIHDNKVQIDNKKTWQIWFMTTIKDSSQLAFKFSTMSMTTRVALVQNLTLGIHNNKGPWQQRYMSTIAMVNGNKNKNIFPG
jgi:hypothetical protein